MYTKQSKKRKRSKDLMDEARLCNQRLKRKGVLFTPHFFADARLLNAENDHPASISSKTRRELPSLCQARKKKESCWGVA